MEEDKEDQPQEDPNGEALSGSSRSIGKRASHDPNRPTHHRMDSLRRSVSATVKRSQSAVVQFLGLEQISEDEDEDRQALWDRRRVTMARRFGGMAKPSTRTSSIAEEPETTDAAAPVPNPLLERTLRVWKGKPSVAAMAWKKVSKGVVTPGVSQQKAMRDTVALRRLTSFPAHVAEEMPALDVSDITIKNERFFDAVEPTVVNEHDLTPAQRMAIAAFATPKPSPRVRPQPILRGRRSAPLAEPEPTDETDIVGAAELVRTVIKPREKSRFPGMDFMSRVCPGGSRLRRDAEISIEEKMFELLDHRPYFTYWATIVQILVLLVSLAVYGFAPVGIAHKQQSSLILETSLALETVDYLEPENFWLGPRANALIHLGAKYAPCMRPDDKIGEQIAVDRSSENETACCVRNDGSGCVQSPRSKCSKTMATWHKWPNKKSNGRVSGTVCGLDPQYCSDPPSIGPHAWPDDITRWPICKDNHNVSIADGAPHMTCEVVGHPCCTGIRGECQISTREYCDFVQGYFHEDALLCSQVSCMDKICGMLPFLDPEVPDQFYRLWTSIFLHAGLIHLCITVAFQYIVMRDAEKLTGYIRMSIIYIMSGVGGNLASAIFTPYVAEVGPSGSQFGVFACVFVEIIYSWKLLDRPWRPVIRMSCLVLGLFFIGLFPWMDNYAHIFGFAFGFLLSLALLPGIAFGDRSNRRCKVWTIIISLLMATGLFAVLIVLFYIHPIYDCEGCTYLNCVPITENFCDNQKIVITKKPD